jgi:competence protein ComEC
VFVLEYQGRKAFFTGDAPITSEAHWPSEPIDLLKVGHHGSRTSTGEYLLQGFAPKVALIGVGNNTYGHSTQEALQRLGQYGVQIHRTDLEGAIRIQLW